MIIILTLLIHFCYICFSDTLTECVYAPHRFNDKDEYQFTGRLYKCVLDNCP